MTKKTTLHERVAVLETKASLQIKLLYIILLALGGQYGINLL